jgi:hypothetical protein
MRFASLFVNPQNVERTDIDTGPTTFLGDTFIIIYDDGNQ